MQGDAGVRVYAVSDEHGVATTADVAGRVGAGMVR
jgi:hypothetical protein